MNVEFTEFDAYNQEGPIQVVEGSTITFSCTFWDDVTSPDASVFKVDPDGTTDVTSTVMPSGSHSVSSDVATLKPLTALTGPARYNIYVTGVVAGDTWIKKIQIEVLSTKDRD